MCLVQSSLNISWINIQIFVNMLTKVKKHYGSMAVIVLGFHKFLFVQSNLFWNFGKFVFFVYNHCV